MVQINLWDGGQRESEEGLTIPPLRDWREASRAIASGLRSRGSNAGCARGPKGYWKRVRKEAMQDVSSSVAFGLRPRSRSLAYLS